MDGFHVISEPHGWLLRQRKRAGVSGINVSIDTPLILETGFITEGDLRDEGRTVAKWIVDISFHSGSEEIVIRRVRGVSSISGRASENGHALRYMYCQTRVNSKAERLKTLNRSMVFLGNLLSQSEVASITPGRVYMAAVTQDTIRLIPSRLVRIKPGPVPGSSLCIEDGTIRK